MTKTEREYWDYIVQGAYKHKDMPCDDELLIAMDIYVRKLERELQALKHKKAVAAILQKKV